ncbi:MAG: extracellular solute-binding protein [Elusimicrobia bacterium]|nr:extracellular solute-binding protein [Elusimicrobiota bacterium]
MPRTRIILSALLFFSAAFAAADDFNPAGWETSRDFPLIGSPQAVKGGTLRFFWTSFPPTLRTEGPNSNLSTLSQMQGLVYEALVGLHPETLEYMPGLADYWKISPDKRTFYFHINPKARWADGSPVTAEDVVATWEFRTRKDIKDPYSLMMWGGSYDKPVVVSPSVVTVHTKKVHWRLFLYFGGMAIYPAKEMGKLTGEKYLSDYNWKMQMGSGPYELKPEDIKNQESVTLTRRKDYWGWGERHNTGLYNFDRITWQVILDEELAWEKFKKGELDYYVVSKAQRWAQECDFDKVKDGWIQKRKIITGAPQGATGFAFNMRKPPFNDRNVRKAFAYLLNRKRLNEKLFFNQYTPIDSYFPGSIWANPDNPKVRYNPRMARLLLARAGWKKRNKDGWLVNDKGEIFEVTLEYGWPSWDRIFKVIQEDYQRAGIKFNLKLIDPATLMKKIGERNFTIAFQPWGAILFPNPISSWGSDLADTLNNNNTPGFKNKEVDELCSEYDLATDRKTQIKLVHKIDGLIFRAYPYALAWTSNFSRVMYYDRFGHPERYFSKIGDASDITTMWWLDPRKEKALDEAMEKGAKLPVGVTDQDPWAEGK